MVFSSPQRAVKRDEIPSNGPMDKINIQVIDAKTLDRVFGSGTDSLSSLVSVPALGSDEKVRTLDLSFSKHLLKGSADLLFILVDPGTVNVAITSFNRCLNRCTDLIRWGFPSSES